VRRRHREAPPLCRGRRPHHAGKDRVGTQEVLLLPPGGYRRASTARDDRSRRRGVRVADRDVVPLMGAKATSQPEGRSRPEGDPNEEARDRTQGRGSLPAGLARVNVAARQSRQTRFTALLHHVDEAALLRAFRRQRRAASVGVDGVTVEAYEHDLERNLRDLRDRVHSGRYRPRPVRRTYIPKADGGRRPLGVPTVAA
jgi:hypothetical protein